MHLLLAATVPDALTFAVAAAISVIGALGVVLSRNPVHSALMLIMTLFGVAVLFVEENAQFLAAVQVIVYAGAIVVLFLFVIMLLGVDRSEALASEPMPAQRWLALVLGILGCAEVILLARGKWPVGAHSVSGVANPPHTANVTVLGRSVFTTYLLPFEITSALLVIAVIGAVVLARRPRGPEGEAPASGTGSEQAAGEGGGAGAPERGAGAGLAPAELAPQPEPGGTVLEEEERVSVAQRPDQ
ncbi:MAG TPA: NADH-quinone oxidoreductase subunit J [Acidimicrobiales bacterium]|nr:NADH-quinone oxidoreductase subunit J [Acidimicrobiales bacterium]